MRVLHVIDSLAPGGAERVLATTVGGLRARGVRQAIHLLYSDGPLERLLPRSCRVCRGYRGTAIEATVRRVRPDVIQTWVDDAAVLVAPVAAAFGLPFVHRIPNIPSAQYALHPRGDGHIRRFRLALRSASQVCALSDAAADDAARYFDIERPRVVYNGYPLACAPLTPAPSKAPGTCLIVAIGRLSVEKGHRHLIDALPSIVARRAAVRCWIAGEGPLENALRHQIAELGLDDVVTLLGYHEDVQGILRQADLFVMPSIYEGFGNALLQAMVAGLPVVVSDLPVVRRDILRHGPGARLVPAGDADALREAIEPIVADARLRRQLGDEARAASHPFQLSRMIDEFAAIYDTLVPLRAAA